MGLLIAVAARTGDWRVLVGRRLVTLLAFRGRVLAVEREPRQGVVELGVEFPASLAVAREAVLAELTAVLVVFLVTRDAGRLELDHVGILLVALLARQRGPVLAEQGEFRLAVVVEADALPPGRLVAGLALVAILAAMDVLLLVAICAEDRCPFIALARMA